jgi:hypothetical protein
MNLLKCFNVFRLQNTGKLLVKATRVSDGDGFSVYVNLFPISNQMSFIPTEIRKIETLTL